MGANPMKTLLLGCLLLSGCATCREHPVACTVAGVIVAGSLAASFEHRHQPPPMSDPRIIKPGCTAVIGSDYVPACQP
jgi:hypothetical protein